MMRGFLEESNPNVGCVFESVKRGCYDFFDDLESGSNSFFFSSFCFSLYSKFSALI
jgi:hypothetical protein